MLPHGYSSIEFYTAYIRFISDIRYYNFLRITLILETVLQYLQNDLFIHIFSSITKHVVIRNYFWITE